MSTRSDHHGLANRRCHASLVLLLAAAACGESSGALLEPVPGEPGGPGAVLVVVVHTVDARHLKFPLNSFQPGALHHCREDGRRYLTPMDELLLVSPGGRRAHLCPEFSDPGLQLHLVFPDRPALKVTLLCESCITPGGYYPPLGADIRIPWSEIHSIEMLRE